VRFFERLHSRNEGVRLVARHFTVPSRSFSRLLFLPHRRLPAAAHGAAMRNLARFMFIAIATN
jgi:hypothetical protein